MLIKQWHSGARCITNSKDLCSKVKGGSMVTSNCDFSEFDEIKARKPQILVVKNNLSHRNTGISKHLIRRMLSDTLVSEIWPKNSQINFSGTPFYDN